MIKIIGIKEEIAPLIDAINYTNIDDFVTYEYINQKKNAFNIQCKCEETDKWIDYEVEIEYVKPEKFTEKVNK